MKQILALLLALSFAVPAQLFAVGVGIGAGVGGTETQAEVGAVLGDTTTTGGTTGGSTGGTTGTGVSGTSVDGSTGSSGKSASTASTASSLAGEIDCGLPQSGGALQGAISRLGSQLGDAAIDGVMSGLRGSGTYGRAAADILSNGFGGAVDDVSDAAGDYVGDAIGGACGDSSLGRNICGQVGNVVGNYVEGAVSGIGQDLLGDIGLGDFGGLFGGEGGGLESITGSFGGGGSSSVPTNDENTQKKIDEVKEINTNTLQVVTETDEKVAVQLEKECILDPTVATLGRKVGDEATAKSLEVAAEQQNVDPSARALDARLTGASQLLNDSSLSASEQALVNEWVTAEVNGETPANCAQGGGIFDIKFLRATQPSQCNKSNAQLYNRLQKAETAAQQAYENVLKAGYVPRGRCSDEGPNPGEENHPELCPHTYSIAVPSGDVEALAQKGEQRILDIDADAIGEAANSLVADLIDEIFTVVADEASSGLRRLISNRISGRGSSGSSSSSGRGQSYLDSIRGNQPTVDQGQNYLSVSITNAIQVEASFQKSTQKVIDSLKPLIREFEDLHACYADLVAHPVSTIQPDEATARANNSNTTLDGILRPQLAEREAHLTTSKLVVTELGVILDQARTAADATALNAASDRFNDLLASGRLHTSGDLTFLIDDITRTVSALELARQDAERQVAQCEAF